MQKEYLIAPTLIALNEGLKSLGMPSKWALIVNWVGGIALNIAISFQESSTFSIETVIYGFLLGSASAGIYDTKKLIKK